MVVGYADGRSELVEVEDARGTDNRPLTDAELEVKFRTLAGTYASDCTEIETLIEAIWSLEAHDVGEDDAGDLLSYAVRRIQMITTMRRETISPDHHVA